MITAVQRKSLGQNGPKTDLDSDKVRQRLQAVQVASARKLALELYGGEGKLTNAVYRDNFEQVVVVEKDKRTYERLKRRFKDLESVQPVHADNVEYVTQRLLEAGPFDLVDFDAWGCPMLLVEALFKVLKAQPEQAPREFVLALTDGMLGLVAIRGRANFYAYYAYGEDRVTKADEALWEEFEALQAHGVKAFAEIAGYQVEVINAVRNKERTALYSAYRLWKGEPDSQGGKMVRRELKSKALDGARRRIKGYFSTSDKDRQDEIILPEAFERTLEKYRKNPVVLVNHDPNRIAGKALQVGLDEYGAFCEVEITKDDVWEEIEQGTLRGFSWQGMIKDYKYEERQGKRTRVITDVDLWEITVTPVPVNPNCLFSVAEARAVQKAQAAEGERKRMEKSEAEQVRETAGASEGAEERVETGQVTPEAVVGELLESERFKQALLELVRAELAKEAESDQVESVSSEASEVEAEGEPAAKRSKSLEGEAERLEGSVEEALRIAREALREALEGRKPTRKGLLDTSYDPYKQEDVAGTTPEERLKALLALEKKAY